MRWPSRSDSGGFTVLEVLISIFLMVVISFAIYQATTETYRLRDVLSGEGEFYNTVRLSMSVLQRDIENTFTPVSLRPEPVPGPQQPGEEAPPGTPEITPNPFYASSIDKHGIRVTRFEGKDSQLAWVAASNVRMYRDSRESEFLKVRYELAPENDPDFPAGQGLRRLVRIVSPDVFEYDEDKDKSARNYTLLHGIKNWKFRYYSTEKKQWFDSWDSDASDTREKLPDLIEVRLEVTAPKGLSYDGHYQFRPEMPTDGIPSTL